MVCVACGGRQTKPSQRPPAVWGPSIWSLLHGLAELSTTADTPEIRIHWTRLLETLPEILPCRDCRQHASAYIQSHPIALMKQVPVNQLYAWICEWLYTFHNAVNTRLGKPLFSQDALKTTYATINLRDALERITHPHWLALISEGFGVVSWNLWTSSYLTLLSLYKI